MLCFVFPVSWWSQQHGSEPASGKASSGWVGARIGVSQEIIWQLGSWSSAESTPKGLGLTSAFRAASYGQRSLHMVTGTQRLFCAGPWCVFVYFHLWKPYNSRRGTVIIPVLQPKSLRHREAKSLAQGHTARKRLPWDSKLEARTMTKGGVGATKH